MTAGSRSGEIRFPFSHNLLVRTSLFHNLTLTVEKNMKMRFPLWQFLNQPVFDQHCPLILNPTVFWQRYQLEHLERCWFKAFRPEERFRS